MKTKPVLALQKIVDMTGCCECLRRTARDRTGACPAWRLSALYGQSGPWEASANSDPSRLAVASAGTKKSSV